MKEVKEELKETRSGKAIYKRNGEKDRGTVVQTSHESGRRYWATHSPNAHLFWSMACSALFSLLARSAALIPSPACSLTLFEMVEK